MNNQKIRIAAITAGVRMWQIADALNIQDSALSRKMRKELKPEERDKILAVIAELGETRRLADG